MAYRLINPKTNGSANPACTSWIDAFVDFTDNLGAPVVFRRWAAIGAVAAVLEQKVWMETYARLYPNLFLALIGHPGAGKSTSISQVRRFLDILPDFWIAPTQMTRASLIDAMIAAKKYHPLDKESGTPPSEYNSMICMADEWGALISDFQTDFISTMTTLYDVTVPYSEWKRTGELRLGIKSPQLSILAGSTPSVLLKFMPEHAWDQGFTSRIILIYSSEKPPPQSHFQEGERPLSEPMVAKLKAIYGLRGQFIVDPSYQRAVDEWRLEKNELPRPTHPKLVHYNTRRSAHIYKLSMVASVDRANDLHIIDADFRRAIKWLGEIEGNMPDVFSAGSTSIDAHAMDDIADFVSRQGKPVGEQRILRHAANIVASDKVVKVLHIMEAMGRLEKVGTDSRTKQVLYVVSENYLD